MIPDWVNGYIGMPFKDFGRDKDGVDCWGLVRLVMQEVYGIEVPSYLEGYGSALDRISVGAHIKETVTDKIWNKVAPGEERAGDVLVTRVHRLPAHVGIIVAPRHFLHIQSGCETVLENYTRPKWKSVVVGAFRHESLSG